MICLNCKRTHPSHYKFCSYCGKELLWIRKEPENPGPFVYQIAVRRQTSWQPEAARRLMEQLLTITAKTPLLFRIIAENNQIVWQIVNIGGMSTSPEEQSEERQIVGTIQGFYPETEIRSSTAVDSLLPTPFFRYLIRHQLVGPFPAPIASVSSLTKVDPLNTLAQLSTGLGQSERIVYTIAAIGPVEEQVYQQGRQEITQSAITPFHFLSLKGIGAVIGMTVAGATRQELYVPELQKVMESKLRQALHQVLCLIEIDAPSRERVKVLTEAVYPFIEQFDMPSFNGIRWIMEPWPNSIFTVQDDQEQFFTSAFARALASMKFQDFPLRDSALRKTFLFLSPEEIASLWHLPHEGFTSAEVVWAHGRQTPLPHEIAARREGAKLGTNTYHGVTRDVCLPYGDRVTHINIIGKTRVGKSTLLAHIIAQDIERGQGVGVIDPHGDLVKEILQTSIPQEREKEVVLFDLADPDYSVGLNLLAVPRGVPREVAISQTIGILKHIFAEDWSGTRMENAIYSALSALVNVPEATIRDLPRLFLEEGFRQKVLRNLKDQAALDFWKMYERQTPTSQQQWAMPVFNRVSRFYRSSVVANVVCQTASLDIGEIMDGKKIFLASLASEGSESEAWTIGAALISKIQLSALVRAKEPKEVRQPFYLFVDEVQNFATTSLPVIFSEAAKYGLSLTVANQFLGQLAGETLAAVMGNTGTTIIFRVGIEDAPKLAAYVRPEFTSDDLVNLDRFEAVVKMQVAGQTAPAFSMMTLKPPKLPEDAVQRQERIRDRSRAKYARPREKVEGELIQRYKTEDEGTDDYEKA